MDELELYSTALSCCLPAHIIFQRIFSHTLPCRWTTRQFLREVSLILVFSVAVAEIPSFVFLNNDLVQFASTLSTSQGYMIKK